MTSMQTPQARFAQPGMPVRQQNLADPYAIRHTITEVTHTSTGIKIITNQGAWLFRPDEMVTFPRRPDGAATDWRGYTPTALDLAIGDVLDPHDGAAELAKPEYTDHDRIDAAQYVTAVSRNPQRPGIISVNTRSAYSGAHKMIFRYDEPITFPRPRYARDTERNPFQVTLTGYGPYLYVDHTTQDEYLYFYVTHPSGGGRWPAYLANPIPLGHGTYLAKPPAAKQPWPAFVGERWERHPKDPLWDLDATAQLDSKRLKAAYQAYADYQERQAQRVQGTPGATPASS